MPADVVRFRLCSAILGDALKVAPNSWRSAARGCLRPPLTSTSCAHSAAAERISIKEACLTVIMALLFPLLLKHRGRRTGPVPIRARRGCLVQNCQRLRQSARAVQQDGHDMECRWVYRPSTHQNKTQSRVSDAAGLAADQ